MAARAIVPPYAVFTDRDGTPLEAGYVYIGTAGLNPEVNPINVYLDVALTVPVAQPIRTLAGYPSANGTPAQLYVDFLNYSITVRDKNGILVATTQDVAINLSAGNIANTPAGSISATDVQSAINELDTEKVSLAGSTGTGGVVLADSPTITSPTITSPTLTSPVLGIPASGVLTNCTGLPVASIVGTTGTGDAVLANSPTLVTPNLGTPSTLVGTNITGTAAGLTVGNATLATNSSHDSQVFTTSGTWTKPAWCSGVEMALIEVWGGGGNGAAGAYGGGGGGGYSQRIIPISSLGATETVTIGAGAGVGGGAGGVTTFGTLLSAYGGGGNASTTTGGGGGGGAAVGANGSAGGTGGAGYGALDTGGNAGSPGANGSWGGGGGGNNGGAGGASLYGGGGGSGNAGAYGGSSRFGGNGGANGAPGVAPGGGGGQGSSGGARGECRVRILA